MAKGTFCEMPGRVATLSLCVVEHWMLHWCPFVSLELAGPLDTVKPPRARDGDLALSLVNRSKSRGRPILTRC